MGKFILRFETDDGPRYLEYSTIVDAPVTFGMTLAEFKKYYRKEHGEQGMRELDARLARADEHGTSSLPNQFGGQDDLRSEILCNRAGRDETRMTVEQMRDWYCCKPSERAQRNRDHAQRPVGEWKDDEDQEVDSVNKDG